MGEGSPHPRHDRMNHRFASELCVWWLWKVLGPWRQVCGAGSAVPCLLLALCVLSTYPSNRRLGDLPGGNPEIRIT